MMTVVWTDVNAALQQGQGQKKQDFVYIIDVLAVHEEVFVDRPLKERCLW